MSIASSEFPPDEADSRPPCRPPETRAVLPVLWLSDEQPWLRVFYTEPDAVVAAQEHPKDDFIDVRGILLRRAWDDNGGASLQAPENARSCEPRTRVMDALRAIADLSEHSEETAEELRVSLRWLDSAPDLASLVNGLGVYPTVYTTAYKCQTGCSAWMRTHPHPPPPCCPAG